MDIQRIRAVISLMNLNEKVALSGGKTVTAAVDRLKAGSINLGEGLMFNEIEEPSFLALGCTFSEEAAHYAGYTRACKAARQGHAFSGTLSAAVMRDPMSVDAAECFSEDALLTGRLCASFARAHSLKPIVTGILGQGGYSKRQIDPRALHELYLYPLRCCAEYVGAAALPGGSLNGELTTVNRQLYETVTGYIGLNKFLLCDYGAAADCVNTAAVSGVYQLGMSGRDRKKLYTAVESGKLAEAKLNYNLERLLMQVAETNDYYKKEFERGAASAVKLLSQSSVLLKNDGILPLTDLTGINLIGNADRFYNYEEIKDKFIPLKVAAKRKGKLNAVSVVFLEGFESGVEADVVSDLAALAAHTKIILILAGTNACEVDFLEYVNALLFIPAVGAMGEVLALLTGEEEPSGRLPFTWAKSRGDYPCALEERFKAKDFFCYESVYNGYRYFNNFDSNAVFEFGAGSGYTEFELSKLKLSARGTVLSVEFVVKNIGEHRGTAVPQVYLSYPATKVYGLKGRLAAFKKIFLEKTENCCINIDINLHDFAVYDSKEGEMKVLGGRLEVGVGFSSRSIVLKETIKVPIGSKSNAGLSREIIPSYYAEKGSFMPSATEVEKLLNTSLMSRPDMASVFLAKNPEDKAAQKLKKKVLKGAQPITEVRLRHRIESLPASVIAKL